MAGDQHVVDVSFWDYVTRLVQGTVALISLGLGSYLVAISESYPTELALATAVWTLIVLGYYMISVHALPILYNYIVVIFVEFSLVALWITSVGTLANLYANLDSSDYFWGFNGALIALIVLAGLGFVLHLITLAMVSTAVRRHRQQALPLLPSRPMPSGSDEHSSADRSGSEITEKEAGSIV